MSCKYCDQSNHFILTDEILKIDDILILTGKEKINMTGNELLEFKEPVFVYIDRGYLRLTGIDSDCIDHGEKIRINYCPMCGNNLLNEI